MNITILHAQYNIIFILQYNHYNNRARVTTRARAYVYIIYIILYKATANREPDIECTITSNTVKTEHPFYEQMFDNGEQMFTEHLFFLSKIFGFSVIFWQFMVIKSRKKSPKNRRFSGEKKSKILG